MIFTMVTYGHNNGNANTFNGKQFIKNGNLYIFNENILDNMKHEWRTGSCNECSSWMYDIRHPSLRFTPEKDYPAQLFTDNIINNKLKPIVVKKSYIEKQINQLIEYLKDSKISMSEAKVFLRYTGIHKTEQLHVLKNFNVIASYELPSAWYQSDNVSIFVDAPMHLLMLGVTKAVMLKVGACLREIKQSTQFIKMVKGVLKHIKQLNIEWCKILEYPTTDTTGGWVSENFLAMARLGSWFYHMVNFLPLKEKYKDPETIVSKWTKQQCVQWLHVRGLEKIGIVSELKKQIKDYIDGGNCPPIKKKNDIGKNDILDLIYALCTMIKKLMCNNTSFDDITRLEAVIRMFLIRYDRIDLLLDDGPIPAWISQYNFLCLLNLPDTMRNYGSIRNIWEGGINGESYLKTVKGHLKAGLVNEWQTWVITNLLKEKTFEEWKEKDKVVSETNIRKEIRIYGNYDIAIKAFNARKPISVLAYNQKVYICYRDDGKIKGTRIKLDDKIEMEYGLVYYSISLKDNTLVLNEYDVDYVGVLMLPMLTKDGYPTNEDDVKYCYIRSDWT